MPIVTATQQDIPSLVRLLNKTYRGEASKQGWTTEADLVAGPARTDEHTLEEMMQAPHAVFLKSTNGSNDLEGCVFLQQHDRKLYLGMLSVSPLLQAKGLGKQLMVAAEEYAKDNGCHAVFMRVVSRRPELLAWYERRGYRLTGAREPFPDDPRFGVPTQPLEFLIMEKEITVTN